MTPESPPERDAERIRREDRRFCDFVAARLREGSGVSLRELFLQAYAQLPGFGDYPGSPPEVAVARDARLRLVGERDGYRGDCTVVKATDLAFLRELEERQAVLEPVPRAVLRQRTGELRRLLQARIRQHLGSASHEPGTQRRGAAAKAPASRDPGRGTWRQATTIPKAALRARRGRT